MQKTLIAENTLYEDISKKVKNLKSDVEVSPKKINPESYGINYLASILINASWGDPYHSGSFKPVKFYNGGEYVAIIPSFESVFKHSSSKSKDRIFKSLAQLVNDIDYAQESENLQFSSQKLSQYNSNQEFEADFAKAVGNLVREFMHLDNKYSKEKFSNPPVYGFGVTEYKIYRTDVLKMAINNKCATSKNSSNFRKYFFKSD